MSPRPLPEGAVAWRALAARCAQRLREAGFATAEVEARRLVERASGYEGADHVLRLDEPATARAVGHLDAMLERRVAGEPLQYVLGAWGFRGLDVMVDRRVLIPRPETEVVVERALAEIDRVRGSGPGPVTVVDLGTGSGVIALAIASEREGVEVWATDRARPALEVAEANLAGIGTAGARVRLAEGVWFDALDPALRASVGVVVSNPPYVAAGEELPAEVADWEPREALIAGPTGLEAIEVILAGAGAWLVPGGAIVCEIAPHQVEAASGLAVAAGYREVEVSRDLAGRERVLVGRQPVKPNEPTTRSNSVMFL